MLLLVAWADLSYGQTAEALGVPLGTVRSRLSRAAGRYGRRLAATRSAPNCSARREFPTGGYWPQARLDALPTVPDRLLARTRSSKPQDQAESLTTWLGMPHLPSRVRSAAFRALTRLPGLSIEPDVTDAAGRHGICIVLGAVHGAGSRYTVILDRRTFRMLGSRQAYTSHMTSNTTGRRYEERALTITAIVRAAVTDKYMVVP